MKNPFYLSFGAVCLLGLGNVGLILGADRVALASFVGATAMSVGLWIALLMPFPATPARSDDQRRIK